MTIYESFENNCIIEILKPIILYGGLKMHRSELGF